MNRPLPLHFRVVALIVALLIPLGTAPVSLQAATLIWDADLGTGGAQDLTGTYTWASGDVKFWNTSSSTDVATTNDTSTDIAQFGNGGTLASSPTINVSTQSIGGLIFGATTTSGYTLTASSSGQVLTIGGSGITMNSGAQATSVGSANLGITLGAAQSWTNNDDSLLTIGGAVNKAGYLLTIAGTGNTTINGKISGGGGLTKDGGGTLTLGGLNDFSGGMILNAGVLNGTATQSFTGGLTVNGGSLGSGTFLQNIAVNFMASSSIATGTSTLGSAAIDSAAIVTLNGAASGNGTASYTFTNGLSGSGQLRFIGGTSNTPQPKILDIKNSSGFTGTILIDYAAVTTTAQLAFSDLGDGGKIISGGPLAGGNYRQPLQLTYTGSGNTFDARQLEFGSSAAFNTGITIESNGAGALVFNTPLSVTSSTNGKTLTLAGTSTGFNNAFNGVIANGGGTAVISVAKSGASTWILSNTNTYTGGTSLTGGTLQFTKTVAMPATGAVAVATGATLAVNAGAASNEWTNATSGNGSIGGLLAGLGGQAGGTVTYSGAVTLGIDTTNATAGTMTYSGVIGNVTGSTSTAITKLGTGTSLVLSGSNTFSGLTTVTAGTLKLNNNLALQNSALVTTGSPSLTFETGITTPTIGGLSGASGNLATIFTSGYGSVAALTLNPQSGVSVTYGGIIAEGAVGMTLTKSGAGEQILSGSNTFTGGTSVSAGTLTIATHSALGASTATRDITTSGTVTVGGNGAVSYALGDLNVTSGTTSIPGSTNRNYSFTSVSGAGALVFGSVAGTPTYTLADASAFTGGLTLASTSSSSVIADFTSIGNGGSFRLSQGIFGQSQTFRYSGSAASNITRDIDFDAGAAATILALDANGASNAAPFVINGNVVGATASAKTLQLQGAGNTGDNTFNGTIQNTTGGGVISVTKSGNSIWLLTNTANSYTGVTTISAGTLRVSTLKDAGLNSNLGAFAAAGAAGISLGGGTLQYTGASGVSVNRGVTLTATSTIDVNPAATTLTLGASAMAASTLNVTGGSNGSSLGLGALSLTGAAVLNPTGADLTVASISATAQNLTLGGTTTGNSVGAISTTSGTLTKNTASTWTLTGTNNYTGTTSVTGGLLRVNGSLNALSAVTVSGTAASSGFIGGTGTIGGSLTLSTATFGGGINLANGSVGVTPFTVSGTLASTSAAGLNNFYFDLGSSTTDQIVASGAFNMTTAGAVVISPNQIGGSGSRIAANTYDIITSGSGTALAVANAGNFRLSTTKAFGQTFSLSSSTSTILKLTTTQVAGVVLANTTLSGTTPSWQDSTKFSGAAIPDYMSNVIINSAIGASLLNASTNINSLTFGTSATTNVSIGQGSVAANTPFSMLVIEAATNTGNTAPNGITLNNASGTHTISANIGLASSQTWTVATGGILLVSGTVSDFGGGYGLTKAGSGLLDIKGGATPTYTGTTTITGGAILGNATLPSGNLTLNGGVYEGYNNAGFTRPLGSGVGQIQITGGISGFSGYGSSSFGITGTGSSPLVWNSPYFNPSEFLLQDALVLNNPTYKVTFTNNIDLNGANRTVTSTMVIDNTYTGGGFLTGNLTNSTGTAGLTKNGVGQLVLSGVNTYNGGTTISGGILNFTTLTSMPATGAVSVSNGATLGVTVNTGVWVGGASNGGIAGLTNGLGGQAGSTVSFAGNSNLLLNVTGDTTESNAVGNGGATNLSLIKIGANALTLSNTNTFTGSVTVSAGSLTLSGNNSLSSATVNAGTLVLGGDNAMTGATTLNAGTLTLAHANAIDTSTGVAALTGTTLNLRNNSATIFNTPLTT
ncbi:MAG: autotransporter-associated beta strand repeat-containing protein, partial [Verrucomicrobia bacterium]|nr:autotransporter-associated beta strand repeat-containing protein [Verrucomicrobiota bacterium]